MSPWLEFNYCATRRLASKVINNAWSVDLKFEDERSLAISLANIFREINCAKNGRKATKRKKEIQLKGLRKEERKEGFDPKVKML